MLNDCQIIGYFGNTRANITTAGISISIENATFNGKASTLLFYFIQRVHIHFHCVFIDQRTNMVVGIQRIANSQLLVGIYQSFLYIFINTFVDDEPAGGSAALTSCTHSAEYRTWYYDIHIRMLGNNDGIVTA